MKEKGFRRLNIWQESHEFAIMVYKATEKFPKEEKFGLTSQIRRAAFSVPANIVEGYAYGSNKKFLQFLDIATGSLAETEYYLLLAKDLNFLEKREYGALEEKRAKVGAYLNKFKQAVRNQGTHNTQYEI
ncbi:MAG: four helix bundle protein [Candidatus Kryptoniota bacterium]